MNVQEQTEHYREIEGRTERFIFEMLHGRIGTRTPDLPERLGWLSLARV